MVELARYSIIGATPDEVDKAGGKNIKHLVHSNVVFADLDADAVRRLKAKGYVVSKIKSIPSMDNGDVSVEGYRITDIMRLLNFPIGLDGDNVCVAVIDSGISRHNWINGKVIYSENFTTEPDGDLYNHGTAVASIITDLAPGSRLIDLKAMTQDGSATDEAVALAIDRAIELHKGDFYPVIINISLGDPDDNDPYNPVRIAIYSALGFNMYVVAAAGNRGPSFGTINFPASIPSVISVGSLSYFPNMQYPLLVSDFSSRGPANGTVKPDVVMPGDRIVCASNKGQDEVVVKSGTSFAAPVVSSILAMYCESVLNNSTPLYLPDVMISRFLPACCVKPSFASKGKDNTYGYGIIEGGMFSSALHRPIRVAEYSTMVYPVFTIGLMASALSDIIGGIYE